MTRGLAAILVALVVAAPGAAAVRVVEPFPLERYAGTGAIGLAVPGAGPAVTRESALNTLLTGEVHSSVLGGTPPGTPIIELDTGPAPDTLVVLPPAGRTENERYPIAVTPGPRGVLTSDSTRIDGLVSLADVANGKLEVVGVDDPVATLERLERRIERNDRWRMPLTFLVGGLAYLAAAFAPRLAPRVFLVALAANLWIAGWWVVALVALAGVLLPLGFACAAVLAAYLLVLGLDPEAVALSPFGPSQAGRFYGLSNLLETMLLVPALLGAWVLGRLGIARGGARGHRRRGKSLRRRRRRAARAARRVRDAAPPRGGPQADRATGRRARCGRRRRRARARGARRGARRVEPRHRGGPGRSRLAPRPPRRPARALGAPVRRCVRARRSSCSPRPRCSSPSRYGVRGARSRTLCSSRLLVSLVVNDTPSDVVGIGAAAAVAIRCFEGASPRVSRSSLYRLRAMRRPLAVLALLLAAIALVAVGCSEGEVTATPETVEGTIPEETTGTNPDLPALELTGDAAAGKEVFASQGCGSCHTLSEAGASGTIGPNLDEAQPSDELVVERVTLGQGGMPAFGDTLEPQQIADVAEYVSSSAGG